MHCWCRPSSPVGTSVSASNLATPINIASHEVNGGNVCAARGDAMFVGSGHCTAPNVVAEAGVAPDPLRALCDG